MEILIKNKIKYDVIVIGAGPSGVSSAINCAKKGLKVLIVDSNSEAGGQIYRAPPNTYKSIPKNKLEENEIQKKLSIEVKKFQIVGPDESDVAQGKISYLSPIGRAMMNKKIDDDFEFQAPGGKRYYCILSIKAP